MGVLLMFWCICINCNELSKYKEFVKFSKQFLIEDVFLKQKSYFSLVEDFGDCFIVFLVDFQFIREMLIFMFKFAIQSTIQKYCQFIVIISRH